MVNESESESVPPSDWLPEPPSGTSSGSPSESQAPGTPYVKILVTYACVILMGMALAWAFLSMRAVMGVGGSCASGGPYQVTTPCPDGSWLIALAIPLLLVCMFVGSGVGMAIGAPALLLPMWALLFTSLGWNFLEYGFTDGVEVGNIVCGVLFWAMAAPAWLAMVIALKESIRKKLNPPDPEEKLNKKEREAAKARASMWAAGSLEGSLWWWLIYTVLIAGGAFFGVATYSLAAA